MNHDNTMDDMRCVDDDEALGDRELSSVWIQCGCGVLTELSTSRSILRFHRGGVMEDSTHTVPQ